MSNFINGLYKLVDFISTAGTVVLIIAIMLAGISAMFLGAEGQARIKENIKMILVGSALVFGASMFAKEIISWFS